METRSKRRRLMKISSHVSSWPHVPARFESLNDDTLTTVLGFVGNKSYRSFGGLNYHCKEIYLATPGMTKETYFYGYAPLSVIIDKIEKGGRFNQILPERVGKGVVLYNRRDVLAWALEGKNELIRKNLLKGICHVAAEKGRIDILDEVLSNLEDGDDKKYVFGLVDQCAARCGKLNVLEWFQTKGLYIENECACISAHRGHIHIIQWLQEVKGFKLYGGLYDHAASGSQLHVMKWLREQEVDWDDYNFDFAAEAGNLDILQWLHDEGCPWYQGHYVYERELKPEAVEWLRVNGYGDRIL